MSGALRPASGRYTRLRWRCIRLTQLAWFGLPWLQWDGRQALLADFGAARFYCFGLVLAAPDLVYVLAALLAAVLALWLAAALVERPWCGYLCPHSVYSELFRAIARRIEGRRRPAARGRTLLTHAAWLLLAGWIGFTLVAYASPARALLPRLAAGALAPGELAVMLAYAALAYGNAGWMGARFCRELCVSARFQGALQDAATLVIRYDAGRGEPRALRNRKRALPAGMAGDCVDCTLCLQVCPAGIDIRNGPQHDCIGCGACADACDAVMDKLRQPRGLVGYAAQAQAPRPRLALYGAGAVLLLAVAVVGLATRPAVRMQAARDRAVPLREAADGSVENVYRLHLASSDTQARRYRIIVAGLETVQVSPAAVWIGAGDVRAVPVTLRLAHRTAPHVPQPIRFELRADDNAVPVATAAALFSG
ncbi:MAG TPA: cytochrome c oxidase accessory protein CcoG [Telluria sp.]|nr:cytochrome c oxidase accessory protein CcoG [Telluria sp.]